MTKAILISLFVIFSLSFQSERANANDVKLFVTKITYSDGPLDYPCVVFAGSIDEATKYVVQAVPSMIIVNIDITEWPIEKATIFGLDATKPDNVVRVDRQLSWSPILALRPTWPLDTSSSGDALVKTEMKNPFNLDFQGYVMLDGPDVNPGESAQETHERRQLEDLKGLPNGGRGAAHGGGP